ncbi:MAG: 3-deoxy-D-manno-octulosonic acid kinase [Halomonadaceae bacterium]|nr:MAG: 3-deoxy-D-manno-octulosonic acid kinase [Halomonadaceae bacterium]
MSSPSHNTTTPDSAERRLTLPQGSMLVRPELASEATPDWFSPQWWGTAARPVSSGGRGSAWFIAHDTHQWVLRHYSRGGLAAKVSQRTYGYLGGDKVRSFAEFRLLNHLLAQGLPVPEPIAALLERPGRLTYQAAIVVRTIAGAKPFAEYLGEDNPELWYRVGELVRRFHAAGVDHADLNCHNILVTSQGLYLIDFDKGKLRRGDRKNWQVGNMERLKRSVLKLVGPNHEPTRALWAQLQAGYRGGN